MSGGQSGGHRSTSASSSAGEPPPARPGVVDPADAAILAEPSQGPADGGLGRGDLGGAYAEFACLPPPELIPVPPSLDAAESVSLVLNHVAAYQMLHRSARVRRGQSVSIHGAAGEVGSALLQLGRLAGALADNDSNAFFASLGDLVVTEPTGSNLMDVYLVLVG
jgi:NADPH:quinone reductase-like Zn-dependent oxidoreductase